MDESTAKRFEEQVDRSGGAEACHLWKGLRTEQGYGRFVVRRRVVRANRFALELSLGRPLREGMCALHRCDNPPCCNPEHLWEGTRAENLADMREKGREARGRRHGSKTRPESVKRGERSPHAKLSEADVRAIRARHPAEGFLELARAFGVNESAIRNIVARKRWKHVA